MSDDLHKQAVEAASGEEARFFEPLEAARIVIDAYLRYHADHGDPLVRVSEVRRALGDAAALAAGTGHPGDVLISVAMYQALDVIEKLDDAIQHRFAPGPEDGER